MGFLKKPFFSSFFFFFLLFFLPSKFQDILGKPARRWEKKKGKKKEGRKEKFDRGLIRFAHWKKEEGRRKGRREKFALPGLSTVQAS